MKCKCIKNNGVFKENEYYVYYISNNYHLENDNAFVFDYEITPLKTHSYIFDIAKFNEYFIDINTLRYDKLLELLN
jgi:hypothetical protein